MRTRPLDTAALRDQFRSSRPFPFVVIDNFLEPDFAHEVARSYPDFETAMKMGLAFKKVNENLKVQVTEYEKFPPATQRLADALAEPQLLQQLSEITGVKDLLWDGGFAGGGMHQTASSGLLDVHVDFNRLEGKNLYRRLNLLLYLNPVWQEEWGGLIELWDREVKVRHHAFVPVMNRCVIFETSDHSFHGVTAVKCPPDVQRKSFAVYYYTREAPAGFDGRSHSTIFKARPEEYLKKHLYMPAEKAEKHLKQGVRAAKDGIKKLLR